MRVVGDRRHRRPSCSASLARARSGHLRRRPRAGRRRRPPPPAASRRPTALGTGAQLSLPDAATAEGKTYVATVTTNCGDIELTLDGTKAPQAVASFVELAKQNY